MNISESDFENQINKALKSVSSDKDYTLENLKDLNEIKRIESRIEKLMPIEAKGANYFETLKKLKSNIQSRTLAKQGKVLVEVNGKKMVYKVENLEKKENVFKEVIEKYIKDVDKSLKIDPINNGSLFFKTFHNNFIYEKSKEVKNFENNVFKQIKRLEKEYKSGKISEEKFLIKALKGDALLKKLRDSEFNYLNGKRDKDKADKEYYSVVDRFENKVSVQI